MANGRAVSSWIACPSTDRNRSAMPEKVVKEKVLVRDGRLLVFRHMDYSWAPSDDTSLA